MRVFILKEGKEYNQGVAYLDDGTRVVVDSEKMTETPIRLKVVSAPPEEKIFGSTMRTSAAVIQIP
jgi:endonuclease YncB( thermonuclease family)